jgi:hypothetical protein
MEAADVRQTTLHWLGAREPLPPFELEQRIRRAVERLRTAESSVMATLAAAAFQCLQDAARSGAQRSAAHELLAADALLTYACEAAAEQGVDTLAQLTSSLDFERFEELARAAMP